MTIDDDFSAVDDIISKLKGCTITESLNLSFMLCSICEKILLADLERALDGKIEQILWENAFKKQITFFQHKINTGEYTKQDYVMARLNTMLDHSSGFYIKLLQQIGDIFEISLPFRNNITNNGIFYETKHSSKMKHPKPTSILYICQHCLVHLGDIARYRSLQVQAYNYYQHACNVIPHNGQPYNQLAILECAAGCKLNVVHHYVQALSVSHPFYSARVNLDKIFRKVSKDTRIDLTGKIYVNDVKLLFIKVVGLLCLQLDIEKTKQCLLRILTAFQIHLSPTFPKQFEVILIAVYALSVTEYQVNRSEFSRQNTLVQFHECAVQLLVGIFEAMMQAAPRHEVKLKQSSNLCSIKIILNWLYIQDEGNSKNIINNALLESPSIWQSLCKMLNILIQNNNIVDDDSSIPLPEDFHFRYFVPFELLFTKLEFSNETFFKDDFEYDLRIQRLITLAKSFADKFKMKNFYHFTVLNGKTQFISKSHNKCSEFITERKQYDKSHNKSAGNTESNNNQSSDQNNYSLFGQGMWNSPIRKGL